MSYDATAASEEQLLRRVRAGDNDAYQELYSDHVDGARQLARILVGADQADELVAESFARVLAALRGGGGPHENFRAYLHVTVRNGYRDSLRATRESPVSDQPWLLDDAEPDTVETMVEGLDESVASDALATLPERWQQVLWHVEVEGRKPAEVAELLDIAPRTVSSLAHRAREGLKRAYLDMHAGPAPARDECRWVHARMSQSARGDLSARAQHKLDGHLDDCPECSAAFLVVGQLNSKLAAYVLPLVLLGVVGRSGKVVAWLAAGLGGGAVAGGAATGGAASGGTAAGASSGGASTGPVAVGVVAAVAVAAVAAGAWAVTAHHGKTPVETRPSAAAPRHPAPAGGAPKPAPAHKAPAKPARRPAPKPAPAPAPVQQPVSRASSAPAPKGPAHTPAPHPQPITSPSHQPSPQPSPPAPPPAPPAQGVCGGLLAGPCAALKSLVPLLHSLGLG